MIDFSNFDVRPPETRICISTGLVFKVTTVQKILNKDVYYGALLRTTIEKVV